jgi:methionyl-tRNA formyltransferase
LKSSDAKGKVLFLGSGENPVCQRLQKVVPVMIWHGPLTADHPFIDQCDFALSFGYRHILSSEILDRFKRPVVNLHISYLPWNRGADPNLWSFLEKTPSGVSIHQIDQGIDTGGIYAQSEVQHDLETGTLATSYGKLANEIEGLFFSIFPDILSQKIKPKKQGPGGSFHKSKDKNGYLKLLHSGWNTPLRDIWGAACNP